MAAEGAAGPGHRNRRVGLLPILIRHREMLLTGATIAVVLAAAFHFVWLPLQGHFAGNLDDFGSRRDGISNAPGILGGALQHARGADPYAPFLSYTATRQTAAAPFDQSPILTLLMRPLLSLDQGWREHLWLWMELAAIAVGSWLVASVSLPRHWPWRRLALVVPLLFAPATYNLWHGNVNAIVFLLNALALVAWTRGWQVRCGVAVGIGAAIKIAPVVLLVLFIRRRWWRGALATGAVGLFSLAVAAAYESPAVVREFVFQVVPVLERDDGWYFNQSASAIINRLAEHSVAHLDPPIAWLRPAVLAVDAVLLILTAGAVRPGAAPAPRRVAEFGLGIAAVLLVGGTTWYAHHVHVLVTVAAAAGWAAVGRHRRTALTCAAVLLMVVDGVVAPWFLATVAPALDPRAIQRLGLWWPFLQMVSLPGLTVLALHAALLSALRAESPADRVPLPVG